MFGPPSGPPPARRGGVTGAGFAGPSRAQTAAPPSTRQHTLARQRRRTRSAAALRPAAAARGSSGGSTGNGAARPSSHKVKAVSFAPGPSPHLQSRPESESPTRHRDRLNHNASKARGNRPLSLGGHTLAHGGTTDTSAAALSAREHKRMASVQSRLSRARAFVDMHNVRLRSPQIVRTTRDAAVKSTRERQRAWADTARELTRTGTWKATKREQAELLTGEFAPQLRYGPPEMRATVNAMVKDLDDVRARMPLAVLEAENKVFNDELRARRRAHKRYYRRNVLGIETAAGGGDGSDDDSEVHVVGPGPTQYGMNGHRVHASGSSAAAHANVNDAAEAELAAMLAADDARRRAGFAGSHNDSAGTSHRHHHDHHRHDYRDGADRAGRSNRIAWADSVSHQLPRGGGPGDRRSRVPTHTEPQPRAAPASEADPATDDVPQGAGHGGPRVSGEAMMRAVRPSADVGSRRGVDAQGYKVGLGLMYADAMAEYAEANRELAVVNQELVELNESLRTTTDAPMANSKAEAAVRTTWRSAEPHHDVRVQGRSRRQRGGSADTAVAAGRVYAAPVSAHGRVAVGVSAADPTLGSHSAHDGHRDAGSSGHARHRSRSPGGHPAATAHRRPRHSHGSGVAQHDAASAQRGPSAAAYKTASAVYSARTVPVARDDMKWLQAKWDREDGVPSKPTNPLAVPLTDAQVEKLTSRVDRILLQATNTREFPVNTAKASFERAAGVRVPLHEQTRRDLDERTRRWTREHRDRAYSPRAGGGRDGNIRRDDGRGNDDSTAEGASGSAPSSESEMSAALRRVESALAASARSRGVSLAHTSDAGAPGPARTASDSTTSTSALSPDLDYPSMIGGTGSARGHGEGRYDADSEGAGVEGGVKHVAAATPGMAAGSWYGDSSDAPGSASASSTGTHDAAFDVDNARLLSATAASIRHAIDTSTTALRGSRVERGAADRSSRTATADAQAVPVPVRTRDVSVAVGDEVATGAVVDLSRVGAPPDQAHCPPHARKPQRKPVRTSQGHYTVPAPHVEQHRRGRTQTRSSR